MMKQSKKKQRDLEKNYSQTELIEKLRRLADALEEGKTFRIQIAGERVVVPKGALVNIAHERSKTEEEIEFQIAWKRGK